MTSYRRVLSSAIAALLLLSCCDVTAASVHGTTNPEHPLVTYVRAASGNADRPLSEEDIVKAYGVEAEGRTQSFMRRMMSPHLMKWFRSQLDSYPVLTTAPEQIHLSVTAEEGNVTVLWTTSNESKASDVCYYAASAGQATEVCREGTVWTYNPISIVPWVGSLHGAHMVGLTPAQEYCYRVGDPTLSIYSNTTCFVAPQLKNKDSITVALGGDMGSVQLFGYLVAAQMLNDEVQQNMTHDAFWILGDIAYSTLDPGPQAPNGEFFWDIYMRQEESLANHVPMLATYGNHDFDAGDSGAFINRFRNPNGFGGLDNFYWAYTHGPVKFVSMCTEVALLPTVCNYAPGSPQYVWLEEQFANINRSETPWLILGGHRPMYSSDEATDSGPLQLYIEPLLRKYNVDVEISGHMHDVELVSPVYNNTPFLTGVTQTAPRYWTYDNPQAPVHITAGSMGAVQDEKYPSTEFPWSLFHSGTLFDDAYGYVRLVANRSTLHFTCLQQKDNGVMFDLVIRKSS